VNVIAIAAGSDHTIALTADRTVWTWGGGSDFSLELGPRIGGDYTVPRQVDPSFLSNVTAIAGGDGFTLAVSNGYVYAWGYNTDGQLGTGGTDPTFIPMLATGISNVVRVSASLLYAFGPHSMAMTVDQGTNHFWGWGYNYSGQVGNGTNHAIICGGGRCSRDPGPGAVLHPLPALCPTRNRRSLYGPMQRYTLSVLQR
jgi:alpha-tubulin suppressor-like RCC1 family protein